MKVHNELILTAFQKKLGYSFSDRDILILALTHRSRGHRNNERLEYLGDSILGFIVADELYRRFPRLGEGDLTKMRSRLVRGKTLVDLARGLNLGEVILLGAGELKSGGSDRGSILADGFEAIIGGIYLDSNLDMTRVCVLKLYDELLDGISPESLKDNKTRLQEMLQKTNEELPVYEVIEQSGAQHNPIFRVSCTIFTSGSMEGATGGSTFVAQGSNRRLAEQAAAGLALRELISKSKKFPLPD
ncbi:MAG: ribonuclease III [Gammaproteobacteria bacterium]|nr:ribonuclease III [Gammaproteobacteria bacterium]